MNKNVIIAAVAFIAIAFTISAEAIHTGWFAPENTKTLKNPFASNALAVTEGQAIYLEHCNKCHGIKGKGKGVSAGSLQIELPDFTDKEITMEETDGEWFWKIRSGQFEMPPFQLALTDEQIWKALVYIRTMAK
ncbi:hypothetical protein MNBD_NITROSPINAE02-1681 [hydrothermal vent metagenome]|uniref:Cytochrome c domain-containing protein n=1 Tax=hydrothermal vent metagenome TaxID=652676 RepID=A0A3B1C3P6_9ZZZZ